MDSRKTGKLIAKLRKTKDLTQAQLAEKLNVSAKTVSRWETGTAVDYSYLKELSEILEVTEIELLHGKVEEKEETQRTKVSLRMILRKYYSQIILIIIILLLIIINLVIRIYGFNNCETYTIRSRNQDFSIKGIIVNTPTIDTIVINSVENLTNFDLDVAKVYTYQFSLFSNDTSIYSVGDVGLYKYDETDFPVPLNQALKNINLYLEEEHNKNLKLSDDNLENLYLEVTYIDDSFEKQVLILPLKLTRTFINNKLFYDGGKEF